MIHVSDLACWVQVGPALRPARREVKDMPLDFFLVTRTQEMNPIINRDKSGIGCIEKM
jgi:hypothetical protein